jgi:hypothetical protein
MIIDIFVALVTIFCLTIITHIAWPPSRSREVATNLVRRRQAREDHNA